MKIPRFYDEEDVGARLRMADLIEGIPTVSDRIAQMVVKSRLEPERDWSLR